MTICGISIKRNKLHCKLEGKKSLAANITSIKCYKIQIQIFLLFLWHFYKENNLTRREKRREKKKLGGKKKKLEKEKKKQKPREPPIPPGVSDTWSAG